MSDKKEGGKGGEKKEETPLTPEEEAKKKKKKLLIMAIGGVVLIGAIGGAAAVFLTKKKPAPDDPGAAMTESASETADSEAEGQVESTAKAGVNNTEGSQGGADSDKKEAEASADSKKAKDPTGDDNKEGDAAPDFGQTYAFAPFNVNLGNPLDNHYARMEVTVEFFGGSEQEGEIKKRLPQLRDAIVSVASKKSREFLLGPDGKDQLRLEIKNRLNQYMKRKIENVYITDILIE